MGSGEFIDNPLGDSREREGTSLWVKRGAYRRFNRWMDKQLVRLESRWSHLATPAAQRFDWSASRRTKS